ncbi:SDR family NAD(P)-dependent oxidoreductase [Chryseolinea soli]|uniref:SDR family oxidoreductase n=1 Tax=Chryseolinea soli TaxID=2321403 RepID=A0A385SXF3_9BACT|nr:SDR family oxidoreductase [Chryseolinea soli]AYB33428.1 SDR family oxidoreductase [Chryseolinea soli]
MKQAIITGASKGLGKALALEMASRGYETLLVARSAPLLETLAAEISSRFNVKVHTLTLDLAQNEASQTVYEWCQGASFQPTVLINNAGYACWGYFHRLPLSSQLPMLDLNVQGMVSLTHRILPILQKQPQAYILNVCSTSAYQPVPTMALYAASKAFVRSFTRSLRYELRKGPVSVTCLSPGPMATNFIAQANMQAMQATAQKFEMKADDVARRGVKAMFAGRAEVIPGWMNALSVGFSKILPDALLERIANNLYESKL